MSERSLYERVFVCVCMFMCVCVYVRVCVKREREIEERHLKSKTDDKADVFEIGVQINRLTFSS